jgi:hypothetical protein
LFPSSNLDLIIDNCKSKSIINRKSDVYKVYRNLYLGENLFPYKPTDNFVNNISNVLEDLYDNNEFTVFHFYFFTISKDANTNIDFPKLMLHLNKYSLEYIMNGENITRFYKNIGLIIAINVLVFLSLYDIENLRNKSRNIKLGINKAIKVINKNVHTDLNNTIINFNTKVDLNSEMMLLIYADFDQLDSYFNKFNPKKSSPGGQSRSYSTSSNIIDINNSNKNSNINMDSKNNSLNVLQSTLYNIDSPIFSQLLLILNSSPMDNDTQLIIEKFLMDQYKNFTANKLISTQNKNINYNTLTKNLISRLDKSKIDLIKIIRNFKVNIKLKDGNLEDLNNRIIFYMDEEFIINVLYGRLLRIISNIDRINYHTKTTYVMIDLGKELVNKYLFNEYKSYKELNNIENMSFNLFKTQNEKLISNCEDIQIYHKLGSILISWTIGIKLLNFKIKLISKDDKISILIPGLVLDKLISNNNNIGIFMLPHKIPMIVKPKEYKGNDNSQLGGYLLNDIEYTDSIILPNYELKHQSSILKNNIIYNSVNSLSSVEFKINVEVLDFILNIENNKKYQFYTEYDDIHPLTHKTKLTKTELKLLESFNSRKDLEQNIIGLSLIFREVPRFYIPVRLDYRGRIYCISEYLNYQSIDLAKALLLFSQGEKVKLSDETSINYLKIFGGNCFGNKINKLSFNDRINWVDTNFDDIINFENGILLTQAENKLLFIAFCFEFKKYIEAKEKNIDYFLTYLPIQFDATCNGFQHLTLLVDDVSLSRELNLAISTWNDLPKDFYSFVALKLKKYFLEILNKDHEKLKLEYSNETIDSFKRLASLNIQRNLIKKAIMTIPYNASPQTIVDYIKDEFSVVEIKSEFNEYKRGYRLKNNDQICLYDIDFQLLRKALNVVIFNDYPKLTYLLKYLKDIANISIKLSIPIP